VPCPWQSLPPANLRFCEADVCGWVTQPANTWTNIGFLVVGLVILRAARKMNAPLAGALGVVAVLTTFTSSALHATGTFAGQAIDQAAMFLESALFVVLELRRWRPFARASLAAVYLALVIASTALLLVYQTAGIALFIAHVAVFLGLELALAVRDRRGTDYRFFGAACGIFVLSYGIWWLDELRIVCDPENHLFGGHGAWHLLGAASFYFWFRHFAQFEVRTA
jgi:hypothetical protein